MMGQQLTPVHTLYSFRRCPYAMRARMALRSSAIELQLREVVLKNKPVAMLEASSKATVPVLVLNDGTVIDESLEIMLWSLRQNDPLNLLSANDSETQSLIRTNDNIFKIHLDHYKYSERFPEHTKLHYRQKGEEFLNQLNQKLKQQAFLLNNKPTLADIAIFPFIRQFAHVDIKWFENSHYSSLSNWLNYWLDNELFLGVMSKYPQWEEGQEPVIF